MKKFLKALFQNVCLDFFHFSFLNSIIRIGFFILSYLLSFYCCFFPFFCSLVSNFFFFFYLIRPKIDVLSLTNSSFPPNARFPNFENNCRNFITCKRNSHDIWDISQSVRQIQLLERNPFSAPNRMKQLTHMK